MSDVHQVKDQESARVLAIVAWVLLIAGWPTLHLATLGGVILAYVQRNDARGTVWESHYEAVISTFWTGLVVGILAIVCIMTVVFAVIGIPLLIGLGIWFLYRSIRGLVHAIDNRVY